MVFVLFGMRLFTDYRYEMNDWKEVGLSEASADEENSSKSEDVSYEDVLMCYLPEEARNRFPFATLFLMGISILMAVILLCQVETLEPSAETLVNYGANNSRLTLWNGEYWRLVASSFLHVDIKHLIFNMLCLFSIGVFLEKLIGSLKILCVYLLTAVAGSLFSCVFNDSSVVCVGASGAVFGLFGASVAYVAFLRKPYDIPLPVILGYMKNIFAFLGINFIYSLLPLVIGSVLKFNPGVVIDISAHFGGLLGGLYIGCISAIPILFRNQAVSIICGGLVYFVSIIASLIMLVSAFDGSAPYEPPPRSGKASSSSQSGYEMRSPERMSLADLKKEVRSFIEENTTKNLKKEGYSSVNVIVSDLTLFHDGGNDYRGVVQFDIFADGESEIKEFHLSVVYDGETLAYEIGDEIN